jgi:hypothetical protein
MSALSCSMTYLFTAPRHTAEKYAAKKCRGLRFPVMQLHGSSGPADSKFEAYHLYGTECRMERRRSPGGGKTITWETKDAAGVWIPGMRGATAATLPLYRERELLQAIGANEPILLVESESSCDALKGWYATTWAGGAGSPQTDTIRRNLGDYPHVVVIGDNDPAGRECTQRLKAAGLAPHVLFSDVDGEDACDLHRRLGPEGFTSLIHNALTELATETPA